MKEELEKDMRNIDYLYADLLVGLWSLVEEQRVQKAKTNLATIAEEDLRITLAGMGGYDESFFRGIMSASRGQPKKQEVADQAKKQQKDEAKESKQLKTRKTGLADPGGETRRGAGSERRAGAGAEGSGGAS